MRIWAVSDIHVDFNENEKWVAGLSEKAYQEDILLLAGDICHKIGHLQETLLNLKEKFAYIFYTPGNHDLWIRGEDFTDSLQKLQTIAEFCAANDILMKTRDIQNLRVIPLLSWYSKPEEGDDSLYWPKPGEDPDNRMWSDNYFIRWPDAKNGFNASRRMSAMNEIPEPGGKQKVVITMSHFIPRKEMIFGEYPPKIDPEKIKKYDRNPGFNFSRVAGSTLIDKQLRQAGSQIHVYGHQHINRDRVVEGVRYVAHCLGYPKERARGMVKGIEQGLKCLWIDEEDTASFLPHL